MQNRINSFNEFLNECSVPPMTIPHAVLCILTGLRLAHWQTRKFAQHEAFGKIYTQVDELGDRLVETFIGKYGNDRVIDGSVIGLNNMGQEFDPTHLTVLLQMAVQHNIQSDDSELLNIVDEIKAQLQQLNYMLRMS